MTTAVGVLVTAPEASQVMLPVRPSILKSGLVNWAISSSQASSGEVAPSMPAFTEAVYSAHTAS